MRRYGLATFWRDKQPGKKDKERGLMEPRLEERWDRMEKEERRTQQQ